LTKSEIWVTKSSFLDQLTWNDPLFKIPIRNTATVSAISFIYYMAVLLYLMLLAG